MHGSERLSQEDEILRQIRLTISSYRTVDPEGPDSGPQPRRKGVMYASYAITSGRRLYSTMRRFGFKTADEFRRAEPDKFRRLVLQPNLKDGNRFGNWLRDRGWHLTIVPGGFYARGWNQEHYMSLWRQVIVIYSRSVALDAEEFPYSAGSAEEFLIGLQQRKRLLMRRRTNGGTSELSPADPNECLRMLRAAVDQVDAWGFDPMPLYNVWRQAELTMEALRPTQKVS